MELDLKKCHGAKFKARVLNVKIDGHVSVDGENVYLCYDGQDLGGNTAPEMFEHKFSWQCGNEEDSDLKSWDVTDMELIFSSQVCDQGEVITKPVTFTYKQVIAFAEYAYGASIASAGLTMSEAFDEWLKDQESSLS